MWPKLWPEPPTDSPISDMYVVAATVDLVYGCSHGSYGLLIAGILCTIFMFSLSLKMEKATASPDFYLGHVHFP